MEIVGNRVVLREIEWQDEEMLLNLIKAQEASKMTGGYTSPVSYAHQMDWFRSLPEGAGSLRRVIADKERRKDGLGIIVLSGADGRNQVGEVYIKLVKSVRGRGYGQDAVNALAAYAFGELGLKCIYSNILENNTASRRLFETCGFKQQGVHESMACKDGHSEKVCCYFLCSSLDN